MTAPHTTDAGYEELEARLRSIAIFRQAADALADMRRQRDEAIEKQQYWFTRVVTCEDKAARAYAIAEDQIADLARQLDVAWAERNKACDRALAADRDRDRYKALAEGERERAAQLAEGWSIGKQTAAEIAAAIRALPPPSLDTGAESKSE